MKGSVFYRNQNRKIDFYCAQKYHLKLSFNFSLEPFFFLLFREKDSSISVEDLLYDIFKHKEEDHLVVGDFLAVRYISNTTSACLFVASNVHPIQ